MAKEQEKKITIAGSITLDGLFSTRLLPQLASNVSNVLISS